MTTPFAHALAGLLALPIYKDDRQDPRKFSQLALVAHEVSQLEPPPGVSRKDWMALVVAIGEAESGYSLRIMEGLCRPLECDRGRARSPWQMHQNDHTRPVWDELQGFMTLHVQVQTASAMLKRSYFTCVNRSGLPWQKSTVLAYAGRGCNSQTIVPWAGLDLRMRYWTVARRAMG